MPESGQRKKKDHGYVEVWPTQNQTLEIHGISKEGRYSAACLRWGESAGPTLHDLQSSGLELPRHLNMPLSSIGGLALLGDKALLLDRPAPACTCAAILPEVPGLLSNNSEVTGLQSDIRPKAPGTPSSGPEVPGLLPPGRGDAKDSELFVSLPVAPDTLRVPSIAAVLGRDIMSAFEVPGLLPPPPKRGD